MRLDTYTGVWEAMPPPAPLSVAIGKGKGKAVEPTLGPLASELSQMLDVAYGNVAKASAVAAAVIESGDTMPEEEIWEAWARTAEANQQRDHWVKETDWDRWVEETV
ncbi:Hypothetical predicted protein [Lecanosticta acicola]|uniref:Uncharacterized protein n=1 Tax=Lecanosticta acicola TaxID=111012 RepID=A0AAI8Z6Z2_9PEZI|nr:Hypothetical predicted protein [Lecanosticta acicola]